MSYFLCSRTLTAFESRLGAWPGSPARLRLASMGDRLMARFQRAARAAAALIGLGGISAPALAANINVDNVQLPYSESLNLNGYIDGSSYSDNGQPAGQIVLTVNNI